jgi:hypothetical protein
MSDRGSGPAEAVIPLAPKLNARSDPNDPLDKAGHLILDMVGQAASIAEANYQQAVEVSRKLSAQLRGADESLRQKSANARRGRIEPRDGCIRSRWRLRRNFSVGERIVAHSHRPHRPLCEIRNSSLSAQDGGQQVRGIVHTYKARNIVP